MFQSNGCMKRPSAAGRRQSEGTRPRGFPVEIMLLIKHWVLARMEASEEGQRVDDAFLDYSI